MSPPEFTMDMDHNEYLAVDVVDTATGTVRLKKKVEDADEMALDTRSTKTVRTRSSRHKS